jgi:hypothetical protein
LIPIGNREFEQSQSSVAVESLTFGQGRMDNQSGVGAKFSLEHVPGMYEGRPERYFDSANDPRRPASMEINTTQPPVSKHYFYSSRYYVR